eukprot:COSAG03_NODE_6383_length_1069_cov_0.571134_1_plen_99_part_10
MSLCLSAAASLSLFLCVCESLSVSLGLPRSPSVCLPVCLSACLSASASASAWVQEKWYTACGSLHPIQAGPDCDVEKAMYETFNQLKVNSLSLSLSLSL